MSGDKFIKDKDKINDKLLNAEDRIKKNNTEQSITTPKSMKNDDQKMA